jgi:hypothetical protein
VTELRITEMPLSEVLGATTTGRQPSPRDLALDEIVKKASEMGNADKVYAWAYAPDKKATATQAAKRSITRTGMVGKVFASTKGDSIIFAQQPLRKSRK